MIRGHVIGTVWATRMVPGLRGQKLLLTCEHGTSHVVVAIDVLDAGVGDRVTVSFGSGARNVVARGAADQRSLLCDAAVSCVIDGLSPANDAAHDRAGCHAHSAAAQIDSEEG